MRLKLVKPHLGIHTVQTEATNDEVYKNAMEVYLNVLRNVNSYRLQHLLYWTYHVYELHTVYEKVRTRQCHKSPYKYTCNFKIICRYHLHFFKFC